MKELIERLDPSKKYRGIGLLLLIALAVYFAVRYNESKTIPHVTVAEMTSQTEKYRSKEVILHGELTLVDIESTFMPNGATQAHGKKYIYVIDDATGSIRGEDTTGFAYNGLSTTTMTSGEIFPNGVYFVRGKLQRDLDGSGNYIFAIEEIMSAP